jgi:hypothetical protein
MTIKLHIERLVVDRGALAPEQVGRFQVALAEALGRLHKPPAEPAPRPRDAVGRLAQRTAQAIHNRMART